MPINSKMKGQLSEARTLYEFQKYNVPVCIPWGDNERYDLVAEFDGKFNRIQVKTCNEEENGAIVCYTRSSMNHTTNKNFSTYENDVDYFVFVNQTRDLVALVPIEEIGTQKAIRLRITAPLSNNGKKMRYFKDFLFEKKFAANAGIV